MASWRHSWLDETVDLSQPDEFSDTALIVDSKKLYTCKGILASASPVWRKMFTSGFKEKDAGEIPLPGKKYEDILELLSCITPAIQKPITEENVFMVLPLAEEYQMQKLKQDCENWLLSETSELSTTEQHMKSLIVAQQYNMENLLVKTVDLIANLSIDDLEDQPLYSELDSQVLNDVLKRRVHLLEEGNGKLKQSADTWKRKYEDMEDCLKKMSREKLTIKQALDEIEGSWEVKGSDARCIDPVHIYGPRNYNCEKCSRQINTYIQSKVWYLLNRGSTWSGIKWPK